MQLIYSVTYKFYFNSIKENIIFRYIFI